MGTRLFTLGMAWAVAACEAPPPQAKAPVSAGINSVSSVAPGSAAATVIAPAIDARALFDEALRAELDGDALEARDRWIRLAAFAPDTPQGQYAARATGGGDTLTLVAVVGVLAAVGVPAFIGYQQKATIAAIDAGALDGGVDGSLVLDTPVDMVPVVPTPPDAGIVAPADGAQVPAPKRDGGATPTPDAAGEDVPE